MTAKGTLGPSSAKLIQQLCGRHGVPVCIACAERSRRMLLVGGLIQRSKSTSSKLRITTAASDHATRRTARRIGERFTALAVDLRVPPLGLALDAGATKRCARSASEFARATHLSHGVGASKCCRRKAVMASRIRSILAFLRKPWPSSCAVIAHTFLPLALTAATI